MNTCMTCKQWDLQGSLKVSKVMANLGFGLCKLEKWPFEKARTFSCHATCNKQSYEQAQSEVVDKRKTFLNFENVLA